jgi:prepilin-type N-terminal cleavage/methylation domain-containing protein
MKTHSKNRSAAAFTLIELLVVISIIALLSSLVVAGARSAIVASINIACKATAVDINKGIRDYQTDYNRLPITPGSSESSIELSAGSPLLSTLLGVGPVKLNPHRTSYIEPHPGKQGVDGLIGDDGSFALMDHWGNPYQVLLDANSDGRIANPDRQNSDEATAKDAPANLLMPSAVFSFGADKKSATRDDVRSWR